MTKSDCNTAGLGERTINLAKQGNTLEERKIKLLVCDKDAPAPQKPCGASLPIGVTSTPKTAKRIRVCSGAEYKQRTCPPQMCDCPPRVRVTPKGMILQTFKFGTKCLIAGSLVFWTWNIGLWGDADKTEKIMVDMRNLVTGDDCEPKNFGFQENCDPPSTMGPFMARSKKAWNSFVGSTFNAMRHTMHTIEGMISPGKDSCQMDDCQALPPKDPKDIPPKKKA